VATLAPPVAVAVEELGDPDWVAVHLPRKERSKSAFIGDRRGYRLRLGFPSPVAGPIRLGHSSSFGLGYSVRSPDKNPTAVCQCSTSTSSNPMPLAGCART
jgi:hypothetical protein